ncbi:Hpt domain-containing protein [Candidatus Sumerlaeota bacterium]|nr:Hpt domain-containing protein [Candidatus Sumerlaeota bacterium]
MADEQPRPVDTTNLVDTAEGDREFIRELIGIFIEDTVAQLAAIRDLLPGGPGKELARRAHSIKGSSANMGAEAMQSVAHALELAGKGQGPGDLAELTDRLEREFDLAKAFLLEWIEGGI